MYLFTQTMAVSIFKHVQVVGHVETWHPVELSVLSSMLSQVCIQKFYLSSVAGLNYDITLSNRFVLLCLSKPRQSMYMCIYPTRQNPLAEGLP